MSHPLRIALVCPLPWPPSDEVAMRVEREAESLARRGHRVTILAPHRSADAVAAGRDALERGDVVADAGSVRVLGVSRAIRTGARRQVAGPIDLAAGLERALSTQAFDVVHVHEPLLPSPLLASLRHTNARTVATFHRADPPAGVVFIGALVERAIDRLDARVVASQAAERALSQVLPATYDVVPAGSSTSGSPPPGSGTLLVARSKDRSGLRFGLRAARILGADLVGPLYVLGPREAVWRTRSAIPKALRHVATALPDDDPEAWLQALDSVRVVMAVTPDDLTNPVVIEARARGRVVIGPRSTEADEVVDDGRTGVLAPPFAIDDWVEAFRRLVADDDARDRMSRESARDGLEFTWDDVAAQLDAIYRRTLRGPARRAGGVVLVDMHLRPGPGTDVALMARACRDVGLDVVAVASPGGLKDAQEFASHAPEGLQVIAGREIRTAEGVVLGLFLTNDIADDLSLEATLTAIRAQGGVTLIPHPAAFEVPSAEALLRVGQAIDCREFATGAMGTPGIVAVRDARRLGVVAVSGSAAMDALAVGSAGVMMPAFATASDFRAALVDAEPVVPRRAARARARDRRRARNT